MASSVESKPNKYVAHGKLSAGSKFNNHKFDFCENSQESEEDNDIVMVAATQKSSGSMFRVTADPLIHGMFVVGTKNGVEERYLSTFKAVLLQQLSDDAKKGLWCVLSGTRWTLNCELVTRAITSEDGVSEPCSHGCLPLTNHVIIHGGTKRNDDHVTPFDLCQLRASIKRDGKDVSGLWFAHCTLFWVKGSKSMRLLEQAFIKVNNSVLIPEVRKVAQCPIDDAVSGPLLMKGENLDFWNSEFRAESLRLGLHSCTFGDHDTKSVDNGDVFEGWVMHKISAGMLESGGLYANLKPCLDETHFLFDESKISPLDGVTICYNEKEEIKIMMGYTYELDGKNTRKLTIEEMLQLYSGGTVLPNFLWHLLEFVESKEGVMCGMTKTSFSIQLAIRPDATTNALMTVTMKGEEQWYKYEDFWQRGHGTGIKFSRGFSILLTLDQELEMMIGENNSLIRENRDKWKIGRYILHTMVIRPFYNSLDVVIGSKKVTAWGDALKSLFDLSFLTRWGIINPTSRYEALKYLYLIAAYCSTRAKKGSYLDMIDDLMAKLDSKRPISGEVVLSLYAGVRGENAAPSEEGCAMIEALANDGDALFEIAIYSLENNDCITLQRFVRDVELGFGKTGGGGGFMYKYLNSNTKATDVKIQLSPLLPLILQYNSTFLYKNSRKLEKLKIVFVAATPGMGKTTYLSEVASRINANYLEKSQSGHFANHCVVMGGDIFIGKSSKERQDAMFDVIERCINEDPSINMVILDRCCAGDFGTLRRRLKDIFASSKLLDIHMLIPQHGTCMVEGNEGDWFLPFSAGQIAVNACSVLVRKHNNGKMPIENMVEGAKGFVVAMGHMVLARDSMSMETLAKTEFQSLAGSFCHSYFKYIRDDVDVPDSVLVAIQLSIGFCLSKENKQIIEKNSKKKVEVADGTIFKTLALGLQDSREGGVMESLNVLVSEMIATKSDVDILDRVWPEWLENYVQKDCEEYLSKVRLPMEETVMGMMNGIFHKQTKEIASDPPPSILKIPFIPQYFGIQIHNGDVVKKSLQEMFLCSANAGSRMVPSLDHLYTRAGDIHVTSMVPSLSISEFAVKDSVGKSVLQRHVTAALDARPFQVSVDKIVSGPTTNAVLVVVKKVSDEILFDSERVAHITLMCAGANKDSIKEERITVTVCDISQAMMEGSYVGKMKAPSTFGFF
jgi:hypothetical protein